MDTSNRSTVFLAAPVNLVVLRMVHPSTRHPIIFARASVLSLFTLTLCLVEQALSMGIDHEGANI
jgi:hypothetical protein